MKYLKRLLIVPFLFLFIIPIAFGEIIITLPGKDLYNLGDKIIPAVSIKEDGDYDGSFSLHIFCDDSGEKYYQVQVRDQIKAGLWTQLRILDEHNLLLDRSMIGKCRLKSSFKSTDGDIVDNEWSEYFVVTNDLNIVVDENLEAKPGEDILISGEIRKSNNEVLSKGEATISFKGNEEKVDVVAGEFEHTIHLSSGAETGNIPILIIVTDKYGNYGEQLLDLKVLPIPTRIENSFENNILMPGDTLKARVVIYDHTNSAISGSKVNVKIFGPDEELIAEKDIQSKNYLEFKTEKTQMPGNYFLLSTFEDVKEQSTFEIETVRKIIMEQKDSFVHIENVGNVEYKDEVTIILESDDKNNILNKKIDLKPEEKITIDLSKEVPEGIYDITIKTKEGIETTNVTEDVPIDDNRNVIKKTADGMSAITGAVVGAAGYVASRPTLAAIILILIVLGTVARYSKGFIINKIKGKKEDDTSHIFEDFKYDEDNKPGN
ncbi:MAG: hypothetical protein IIB81_01615 [Nanoarchaeota archaeon]|nr:hypothetical protein [Nanoarchaeota archaeon]